MINAAFVPFIITTSFLLFNLTIGKSQVTFEDLTYADGRYYIGDQLYTGKIEVCGVYDPKSLVYHVSMTDGQIDDLELTNKRIRAEAFTFEDLLEETVGHYRGMSWLFRFSKYGNVYPGHSLFYFEMANQPKVKGTNVELRVISMFDEVLYRRTHDGASCFIELHDLTAEGLKGTALLSLWDPKNGEYLDQDRRLKLSILSKEKVDEHIQAWSSPVNNKELVTASDYYMLAMFLSGNEMYGEYLACIRDGMKEFPEENSLKLLFWHHLFKIGYTPGSFVRSVER